MNRQQLVDQIKAKKSFLCVGLDTDLKKIPPHLLDSEDPIFAFNKEIIDNTKEFAVAYKPNIAFYEMLGPSGWESLRKTIEYIPDNIYSPSQMLKEGISAILRCIMPILFLIPIHSIR